MARLNRNETGGDASRGNVSVTSSPALVRDRRSNRVSLVIRNHGATTLYWGPDSQLTSANGYPLLVDEEYVFDDYTGAVYIVSATTGDLRFFEVR